MVGPESLGVLFRLGVEQLTAPCFTAAISPRDSNISESTLLNTPNSLAFVLLLPGRCQLTR